MRNRHGDFIWYELMTTDTTAAEKFYGGLVGWSFADAGQAGTPYRLFSADGPAVGGVLELTPHMIDGGARPLWAGYIGVDDVDAAASKVCAAGGKQLMDPVDIPGVGRFTFVTDPEGAPFYLMRGASDQPSESFATHDPRVGHCAWNELMAGDPAAAQKFYGETFGWVKADMMDMGPMGEYVMLKNGDDRDFMFGAVMKKPDDMPVSFWSYYFRVPEIDTGAKYIADNGGQVLNGPMEIPGGDYVLNAVDPQGAMFSLIGARTD